MLPSTLSIEGRAAWRHGVDPNLSAHVGTYDGRPARVLQWTRPVSDVAVLRPRMASRRARVGPEWLEVLAMSADGAERPWMIFERPGGVDLHHWFEACIVDPNAAHPAVALHTIASIARALVPLYRDQAVLPGALVRDALIRPDGGVSLGLAGALSQGDVPTMGAQIRHLLEMLRHLSGPRRPRSIDVLAVEVGEGATLERLAHALDGLASGHPELERGPERVFELVLALHTHEHSPEAQNVDTEGSTLTDRTEDREPDVDTLSLSVEETSLQDAVIDGRYRLLRVIGSGAMGNVYEAERLADGEHVAVKVMRPEGEQEPARTEYVARFRREADLLARLHHPHIVEVHGFGTRGACWIAMELVRGHSLVELLDPGEPLPLRLALTITQQVALALKHAHDQGIVHRDVKPGNLLVASHDPVHVKLCDFGLAKAWDHEDRTVQGALIGTPQYMSPEQARGEPAGVRADLYGTGILLYRLITGRTPFADHPGASVLLAHSHQAPIPMMEANPRVVVPQIVQDVVDRCLVKKAGERYGSADWLVDDLERCLERISSPREPTPSLSIPYREVTSEEALDPVIFSQGHQPPPRPAPPVQLDRRVMIGALAITVMLLGAVVGMGWSLLSSSPAPTAPATAPAP